MDAVHANGSFACVCSLLTPSTHGASSSVNAPSLPNFENQVLPGDIKDSITNILSQEDGLIGSITVHNIETGAGGIPSINSLPTAFGGVPNIQSQNNIITNSPISPQILNIAPEESFQNLPQIIGSQNLNGKQPSLVKLSDNEASSILQNLQIKTTEGSQNIESDPNNLGVEPPPRIIILVKNDEENDTNTNRVPRFTIAADDNFGNPNSISGSLNHVGIQVSDSVTAESLNSHVASHNEFKSDEKDHASMLEKMLSLSFGPDTHDSLTSAQPSSPLVDTPDMSKLPLEKSEKKSTQSSIHSFPPNQHIEPQQDLRNQTTK